MEYLVVYVNAQGNEQKEMFESAQMVSGFVEQLLHMDQAHPEAIKIYQLTQVGFHVETIPVVKIDSTEPAPPAEAQPGGEAYEIQPYEVQAGGESAGETPLAGEQTYDEPPVGEASEEAPPQ